MGELPPTLSDKATLAVHKALQVFGLGEILELVGCALIFGALAVTFDTFESAPGTVVSWAFALGSSASVVAALLVVLFRTTQRLKRGAESSVNPGSSRQS